MYKESTKDKRPLIAHIIYRLAVGGLENGLVNLINHMDADKYRHAIICLTEATGFKKRIAKEDVRIYQLHKQEGKDFSVYVKLWKLLRKIQPDIVHTRNIGTIDCLVPAFFSGVHARIHGEHGRDMIDIDGSNKKHIIFRKILRPFIGRYVALSRDLERWLSESVGVEKSKILQIYNGVNLDLFSDNVVMSKNIKCSVFGKNNIIVIGTVGRFSGEKDQLTLIAAFENILIEDPGLKDVLRLALIGDGPLKRKLGNEVLRRGIEEFVWFSGERDDLHDIYNMIDIFVLPSLGEGISNTILEAMASGLPVIATNVGGNPELVVNGRTGMLVKPNSPTNMSKAIKVYLSNPDMKKKHGIEGRKRIERNFSMQSMITRYIEVYNDVLSK